MSSNLKRTIDGLTLLGLDLHSGTSPFISIKALENITGVRQQSNGLRIIRQDVPPFNMFNHERYLDKDTQEVLCVRFYGYKTAGDEVNKSEESVAKMKEKIKNLQNKISTTEAYLNHMRIMPVAHRIFSKTDVDKVVK